MADEDLKYPLNIIEELKGGLQNALKTSNVGNEKNHEDLVNKFVAETKKNYKSFNDPNRQDPQLLLPQKNLEMLYQNIGEDFKDLVNKLSLDQKQKDEATQIVAKYTNLALESAGFTPLSLSSAGKIIAEDVHKDYQAVVDSLPMTNKTQIDAQAKYKTDFDRVISDLKRGNILDEIAKLNAKLQKDLNLNDRQINELNIGTGHYIHNHRENFKADLKDNLSREDITKLLDAKTAKSKEKLNQTRAQAAKSVVIGARKSATKTVTSQWQNPSKSGEPLPDARVKISQKREKPAKWKKAERSDKNPQIAASDYRNSQEVDPNSSHINNLHNVSNLDKTQVKQDNKTILSRVLKTIPTTKLERVYDAAVRGIEADVKQKANAKFTEIKSTVSHKMPPEAKEFATKIGHDALEKAHAAVELAKGSKNTVKTFVKNKWQGR